jgi:hypothetical protein
MQAGTNRFSRREMMNLLLRLGAASAFAVTRAGFGASGSPSQSRIESRLARFMMKGDFPRLEVISPAYRLVWHGRFFGFRLVSTVTDPYDERISYSNFGPFAVGGVDLLCNQYEPLSLTLPGGAPFRPGLGRLYTEETSGSPANGPAAFMVEHLDGQRRALRVRFGFWPDDPLIRLRFEPSGFAAGSPLLLSWAANFIYDVLRQEDSSAAYYSRGAQTGLRVGSDQPGSVTIADAPAGKVITCRLPADRPAELTLEVLGPRQGLDAKSVSASKLNLPPAPIHKAVVLSELKSWEADQMERRGWKPERGKAKERVAGLFVTARGWNNIVSWVPEATIEHVSKVMLPTVIESRSFEAVGLSRDGVTEKSENPAWLGLVEQAHKSGLRVYMKPGDGELTAIKDKDAIKAWARACFNVTAEQRCDVVRMPWEAVLVPWTTANLCLAPRFHTPEIRSLAGLPWGAARKRIIASVADRFSLIVESIRRYAPGIFIDLECSDTTVLEILLARHDRLGVMYMTYGQYPRVGEYLDLYYCVARQQARASRVVLETDCYYTDTITGLGQLKGRPYAEMYSERDLDLMRQKHRHLCNLPAEAVWSWGINITFTEAKFQAVSRAPLRQL